MCRVVTPELIKQEPKLQFFVNKNLRADLRDIVRPFAELAITILETLPRNPERTLALNKLVVAKDNAVRAMLWSVPE